MKNRILSRVCLAVALLLVLLFYGGGRQLFASLRPSFLEQEFAEGSQPVFTGILQQTEESTSGQCLRLGELAGFPKTDRKEQLLVYVSYDSAESIPETGQRVTVTGTLHFYQEAPNPGNFQQKFYYQKQRIHGYLTGAEIVDIQGEPHRGKVLLETVRETLGTWMERNAGARYGGMLRAMLLGERKAADEVSRELYQKSGISHLLAISGLHVSFLGMGIYHGLRKLFWPRWAAALAGSLVLGAYVVMTGASVSARRALLMFLVRMGAEITGRVYDGVTSLSLAALLILLEQPLWLFDAGFLMSFGAVAGLYLLSPLLPAPLAVNLVLLPLVLYYYFEYPLWSMAWNLAVIPLAPLVFVSGFSGALAGVLLPFPAGQKAAAALTMPAKAVLWFYETGAELSLKLPFSRLVPGRPGFWELVCYVLLCAAGLFLLFHGKERKPGQEKRPGQEKKAGRNKKPGQEKPPVRGKKRAAGMLCFLAGAALLLAPRFSDGTLSVTMVDVGQGDCFFIQTPSGERMLVDGGSSSQKEVGRYRIEPFLKYQGVAELDYVFVTHGDADHTGGIAELLERKEWGVSIRRMVLPPVQVWDEKLEELAALAQKAGCRIFTMGQGEQILSGETALTCLWPGEAYQGEKGNQASLVLSLEYGEFAMLFTGDLEGEGERELLEWMEEAEGLPARWTVLKCGHHGSRHATGEAFLSRVRPVLAWVSAGEGNPYGHPSQEVVERLEKWECTLYNTIEQHASGIRTDGEGISFWTKAGSAH